MNANVPMLDEVAGKNTKEVIDALNETIRQQQAEIEALKMGFANSGTHDSELAETRAMAGRLFLKVQDLEFEQEGYENLTEMLESEKAELTEKNCQQQAELDRAVELYTDKAIENEALKQQLNPPKSTNLGPWQWK